MPGDVVTRCWTMIPESDNAHPGYINIQSPSCGPIAYNYLSYAIFSGDCSTLVAQGDIWPTVTNPYAYLPDPGPYNICFTWEAACQQDAVCATYQYSPLPVELLSFAGEASGTTITLMWATGSESSSSHFRVQRSQDLSSWKLVGLVGAKGNSLSISNYQLTDRSPVFGVNYYRLTEVSTTGSLTDHNAIAVTMLAHDWLFWNQLGQRTRP